MEPTPFVEWDPSFGVLEPPDQDAEGLVWLYDCEGTPLLKCHPQQVTVIAAALEYAQTSLQVYYGMGWGNLSDDLAAALFHDVNEELPR